MYARVPFWCIVLVLFGPFLISSDGIHDLVSTKWEQNDGWMFSPPILTSCSCFLFTPSVCRMPLSRRWWTSGSAIGSPYRLTVNHCNNTNGRGKAISVDRFKTEMVVCTDGRCVGIFVVHPDGPIFLRAGRRPYQQSLPTRHTSTTHFTSQTVRNVCKYGRQGCRHPVPTTVHCLTIGFAERRGTVGLGPVVEQ